MPGIPKFWFGEMLFVPPLTGKGRFPVYSADAPLGK
jgi:hypothetical protein